MLALVIYSSNEWVVETKGVHVYVTCYLWFYEYVYILINKVIWNF